MPSQDEVGLQYNARAEYTHWQLHTEEDGVQMQNSREACKANAQQNGSEQNSGCLHPKGVQSCTPYTGTELHSVEDIELSEGHYASSFSNGVPN